MVNTILAVDKDAAVHNRESTEWLLHGINALRVNTMIEAIDLLTRGNDFLFIAINEDTIPDFMEKLPVMRETTLLPIFVITSNYTIEKKVKAMYAGADVYDHFSSYAKKDVLGALASLTAQNRLAKRTPKP